MWEKQPFKALLGESEWNDMESRRIKCLGIFVSAGGPGFILMMKNWEVLNHRAIPQPEKLGFLSDVVTARQFMDTLTSDISREDALWISLFLPHSRVYWPGDESEVVL